MSNTSGFFAILAAMWSKTSFAITMLRITDGWTKKFVWFIIISVNAIMGFGAMSTYIQCTPLEKLWRPAMEGKCWTKEFIIAYNKMSAGKGSPPSKLCRVIANTAVRKKHTLVLWI
jgi:hypothetical protein